VYKIYVGTTYIHCYSMMGFYSTVSWHEIKNVRFVSTYGMTYLYLQTTQQSAPLTIPVWLKDKQKFISLVRKHAGEQHPLALALEEYAT